MKNLLDKKHKDLLTLKDYSKEEIEDILKLAAEVKKDKKLYKDLLSGKSLAMLFDKHSTRTRLSFEVGISQLGGNSIYLDSKNLQIKRGETLGDTAKVFSKYLDGVIIRTYSQKTVEVFARESMIPVINGLTDLYHPCQVLSDLFTIYELGLLKKDLKFTYVGDSNNVLNSLLICFTILGLNITVGCPEKYEPLKEVINYIKKQSGISGSNFKIVNDPLEAVADADIVYTDVWVSMGDKEYAGKIKELKDFQINLKLLSYAKPDVKIMHCLPAHRGEEITSEAIDGNNSIVWVQAENRLYAQKALLVYLYSI